MKAFIIRFFVFVFLVVFAWLAGITVFGRMAPGFLQKNVRVTYYRNFNSKTFSEIDTLKGTEILIAGSSTAFRSFDPRIFSQSGHDIFIIGSSAQSPLQTEYLVNKYIDRVQPRLFIYVANMMSFSGDGKEGWLFLMNNLHRYDDAFIKGALADKSFILYNTFAYNIMDHILRKPQPVLSGIERYIGSGYVEYTREAHDTVFNNDQFPPIAFPIEDKQRAAFERTVAALRKRNIPLLIVQAPLYPAFFTSITNSKEFDQYFQGVAGARYINFNDYGFHKQDFWDIYHLNQSGVAKFDSMMLGVMGTNKL